MDNKNQQENEIKNWSIEYKDEKIWIFTIFLKNNNK